MYTGHDRAVSIYELKSYWEVDYDREESVNAALLVSARSRAGWGNC